MNFGYTEIAIERMYIHNEKLLINLRDEAHRFAITYHKKARIKRGLRSKLLKVEGIGDDRARKLILRFKNIEGIQKSNVEEINKVIKNRENLTNETNMEIS